MLDNKGSCNLCDVSLSLKANKRLIVIKTLNQFCLYAYVALCRGLINWISIICSYMCTSNELSTMSTLLPQHLLLLCKSEHLISWKILASSHNTLKKPYVKSLCIMLCDSYEAMCMFCILYAILVSQKRQDAKKSRQTCEWFWMRQYFLI